MKIKLTKLTFENGDFSIDTDYESAPYSKIIKEEEMEMVTLNTILKDPLVPPIDILSIDAQAEDLNIIKSTNLDNVVGVICEVEFAELYEGQPLVFDVHKYMHENGFRFCQYYNNQNMNVKPYPRYVRGMGFMTVAEVLFLREPEELLKDLDKLTEEERTKRIIAGIKLAATGICFNQVDFAIHVLRLIEEKGFKIDEITKDNSCYMPSLRNLKNVCDAVIKFVEKDK